MLYILHFISDFELQIGLCIGQAVLVHEILKMCRDIYFSALNLYCIYQVMAVNKIVRDEDYDARYLNVNIKNMKLFEKKLYN
jgi:hypothetical protein